MALFFFLSGFTFNYEKDFLSLLKSKIKNLYVPYICFETIFLLFHHLFYKIGFIEPEYSLKDYFISLLQILAFNYENKYLSPFWFLGTLFFASLLTFFIMKAYKTLKIKYTKLIYTFFAIILWMAGYFLVQSNFLFIYCSSPIITTVLQASAIMVITIIWRDYFMFNNLFHALCGILIICVSKFLGLRVDVRASSYSLVILYPFTVIGGIYFTLYLSKNIPDLFKKPLRFLGQNTLWILALHPIIFRLIGLFQEKILHFSNELLNGTMHWYGIKAWACIAILLGTIIPSIFAFLFHKCKRNIHRFSKTN